MTAKNGNMIEVGMEKQEGIGNFIGNGFDNTTDYMVNVNGQRLTNVHLMEAHNKGPLTPLTAVRFIAPPLQSEDEIKLQQIDSQLTAIEQGAKYGIEASIKIITVWKAFVSLTCNADFFERLLKGTTQCVLNGAWFNVPNEIKQELKEYISIYAEKKSQIMVKDDLCDNSVKMCRSLIFILEHNVWETPYLQQIYKSQDLMINSDCVNQLWDVEDSFFIKTRIEKLCLVSQESEFHKALALSLAGITKGLQLFENKPNEVGTRDYSIDDYYQFGAIYALIMFKLGIDTKAMDSFEVVYVQSFVQILLSDKIDGVIAPKWKKGWKSRKEAAQYCIERSLFLIMYRDIPDHFVGVIGAVFTYWLVETQKINSERNPEILKSSGRINLYNMSRLSLQTLSEDDVILFNTIPVETIDLLAKGAFKKEYLYELANCIAKMFGLRPGIRSKCVELYLAALFENVNKLEALRSRECDKREKAEKEKLLAQRYLQLSTYLEDDVATCFEVLLASYSLNPSEDLFAKLKQLAHTRSMLESKKINQGEAECCAETNVPNDAASSNSLIWESIPPARKAEELGITESSYDMLSTLVTNSRLVSFNTIQPCWAYYLPICVRHLQTRGTDIKDSSNLELARPDYSKFQVVVPEDEGETPFEVGFEPKSADLETNLNNEQNILTKEPRSRMQTYRNLRKRENNIRRRLDASKKYRCADKMVKKRKLPLLGVTEEVQNVTREIPISTKCQEPAIEFFDPFVVEAVATDFCNRALAQLHQIHLMNEVVSEDENSENSYPENQDPITQSQSQSGSLILQSKEQMPVEESTLQSRLHHAIHLKAGFANYQCSIDTDELRFRDNRVVNDNKDTFDNVSKPSQTSPVDLNVEHQFYSRINDSIYKTTFPSIDRVSTLVPEMHCTSENCFDDNLSSAAEELFAKKSDNCNQSEGSTRSTLVIEDIVTLPFKNHNNDSASEEPSDKIQSVHASRKSNDANVEVQHEIDTYPMSTKCSVLAMQNEKTLENFFTDEKQFRPSESELPEQINEEYTFQNNPEAKNLYLLSTNTESNYMQNNISSNEFKDNTKSDDQVSSKPENSLSEENLRDVHQQFSINDKTSVDHSEVNHEVNISFQENATATGNSPKLETNYEKLDNSDSGSVSSPSIDENDSVQPTQYNNHIVVISEKPLKEDRDVDDSEHSEEGSFKSNQTCDPLEGILGTKSPVTPVVITVLSEDEDTANCLTFSDKLSAEGEIKIEQVDCSQSEVLTQSGGKCFLRNEHALQLRENNDGTDPPRQPVIEPSRASFSLTKWIRLREGNNSGSSTNDDQPPELEPEATLHEEGSTPTSYTSGDSDTMPTLQACTNTSHDHDVQQC